MGKKIIQKSEEDKRRENKNSKRANLLNYPVIEPGNSTADIKKPDEGGIELSDFENSLLRALDKTAVVSMTDADGRIIYVNDKFLEVCQYKREELLGENHRILKSGFHPQSFYKELWEAITAGKIWRGEMKNRAKDGSLFWLETSIAPVLGPDGHPAYYIAIRVPITDIKKKEEIYERGLAQKNTELEKMTLDLQRGLSEFEGFFESMGEGAIFSDAGGNAVKMNQAARRMLGLGNKELIGRKISRVVKFKNEKNEIIPERDRALTMAIKEKKTVRTSALYNKKNKKMWLSTTAAPVIINGQVVGAVDIMHDTTLEKELDRIKTDFVSLASHQLRTPLTAIKLFTELLFNNGKLSEQQRLYLENIYSSTNHMVKLVNDLLHVAKIETNSFSLMREPVQLDEVIESTVMEIKDVFPGAHINFHQQKEKKSPPLITDAVLIGQVIKNLISNSLKYSLDKRCEIASVYQENDGEEQYLLTVKDWGIGIPKKSQKKIFEKFYRADNAYITSTDGVGIGLYSSKLIIELFGGKIWFESTEGKGTKFFVELPVNGQAHSRIHY